jgi:hypothetical protein
MQTRPAHIVPRLDRDRALLQFYHKTPVADKPLQPKSWTFMVMLDVWRRGLLGDLSQDEVKLA